MTKASFNNGVTYGYKLCEWRNESAIRLYDRIEQNRAELIAGIITPDEFESRLKELSNNILNQPK
jgi:hypothetical protein